MLLLDEPLAGFSKKEAEDMADLIVGLPHPGQCVLIDITCHKSTDCKTLYVQNSRPLAFKNTDEVLSKREVNGISGESE